MTTIEELRAEIAQLKSEFAALESNFGGRRLDDVSSLASDVDVFYLIWGTGVFDASIAALGWWAFGHTLAYGTGDNYGATGENGFAGSQGFFYDYQADGSKSALHLQGKAFWMFQWAFAGAAATIVSGAVAERCSFTAYVTYATILTSFIYPCVAHMTWSGDGVFSAFRAQHSDDDPHSGGRLIGGCGMIDFAGSATVHMTGGIAALIACIFVGPRTGRFDPDWEKPQGEPVFQVVGILILWLGWYGFNAGSTLGISGYGGLAAHVMMTTTIAAAAGCLTTTALGCALFHYIDLGLVNNGILSGLVGVTSACSTCSVWGALIIGICASPVYLGASTMMKKFKIDDVVDAVAVHGCCGMFGGIAPALFATPFYYGHAYDASRKERCAGVFYGGNPAGSLKAAIAGVVTILCWVGSTMTILFGTLRVLNLHRVSVEIEEIGMDASKHSAPVQKIIGKF